MKDFTITHIGETELSLPMPFKFIKAKGETFNFQADDGIEFGKSVKPKAITFQNDFWLCVYQTTQELWQMVVKEANLKDLKEYPSHFKGKHRPVENISWNDIQLFNDAFNELLEAGEVKFKEEKKPEGNFNLPSEIQWEYAANAHQNMIFSGSQNLHDVAWYYDNSNNQTMPVGLKNPNGLGLYDMNGNVWEWCQNDFETIDNTGEFGENKLGEVKSMCGGGYYDVALYFHLSFRFSNTPSIKSGNIGFRLFFLENDINQTWTL